MILCPRSLTLKWDGISKAGRWSRLRQGTDHAGEARRGECEEVGGGVVWGGTGWAKFDRCDDVNECALQCVIMGDTAGPGTYTTIVYSHSG